MGKPDEKTNKKKLNSGLAAILLLAAFIRIQFLATVDTQPVTDFDWYYERALSIAAGFGYSVDGRATAYWPVGYPGFLAIAFKLFGPSVALGKVLNTLLSLAVVALTWVVARRQLEDKRVSHLAALAMAVHPAMIAYSGILASEPLYTTLLLAGLCTPPLASGLAFGLATLVRPQAIVVPLIRALVEARESKKLKKTAISLGVTLAVALVVLLPWTVRNYKVFGTPVFVSTNGGDNLWIGNNPSSTGAYQSPLIPGLEPELAEPARDKAASRIAFAYASSNMGTTISRWPAKLRATFLSGTDAPYWAFQKAKGRLSVPGLGDDKSQFKAFRSYSVAFTIGFFWLSLLGLIVALAKRKMPWLALGMVTYACLLSVVFFGNPRFAYPVLPFLAQFAAMALLCVVDLFKRPPKPTIPESQNL